MALNNIYRKVEGGIVPGTYLQAFIKNGGHYFVTEIKIYQDGVIDCWGLVDLEGFKAKVRSGWVRTSLPQGARVSMMVSDVHFNVTNVNVQVEEEEFIVEVEDELQRLNGLPTTAQLCQQALETYRQNPNRENKEQLRRAYEAVPKHRRKYLGDMDRKDGEFRKILGLFGR